MALKDTRGGRWWSRVHFLIRFLGLTALIVFAVALVVAWVEVQNPAELVHATTERAEEALRFNSGDTLLLAIACLLIGLVVGLFWLVLEVILILVLVTGRRSAFGFSALLQVVLAFALLLGANVYSNMHHTRFDLTSNHAFTLPTEPVNVPAELSKLDPQSATTILVFMRSKTFGQLADKPDAYDSAAERKVVEKVRDLADQFRAFGSQFKVEVLEIEEEGYEAKRKRIFNSLAEEALNAEGKLTDLSEEERKKAIERRATEMAARVEAVPENSIFFFAGDRSQRLSFNDFYQLDKTASKDANDKKGNLVLLFQGVGPFARKALDVDQRRPRVGILVIHEALTTEGPEFYGLKGVKTALEAQGLAVRDIVLRKWNESGPGEPEPAVYTYDESKYERLDEEITSLNETIGQIEKLHKQYATNLSKIEKLSLEELTKEFASQLKGRPFTKEDRDLNLRQLRVIVDRLERELNGNRDERDALVKERSGLNVEKLSEQRRLTDLKAKLDRQLADCDLVLLPRITYINLVRDWRIGNDLHNLDKAQIDAIKDYIKAGKPVLAAFGPTNEPGMRGAAAGDALETLFQDLGVEFGRSVVLFTADAKAFADRRTGRLVAGFNVEVPPVDFDWTPETVRQPGTLVADSAAERAPNPIRRSMQIARRSVGQNLPLQSHYPRPIGVDEKKVKDLKYDPILMVTAPDSWNEDNPFATRERTPRYEEPKPDDPRLKTFDAPRRGPFPIAVAFEATVPPEWYADQPGKPTTARIAVIGDGGLFTGKELPPAKSRLLLDTCNWLLGRDDLLPRDEATWEYPRVDLSDRAKILWTVFAWLGPPLLFFYCGVVVLFMRKLR